MALAGSPSVQGASFTVGYATDAVDAAPGDGACATAAGECSLRAAIQETNALAGPDVVDLPAGTYLLTIPGANEDASATGDLDITDDLTLTGAGRDLTVIDGNDLDRVMHTVFSLAGQFAVEISGLTVINGDTVPGSVTLQPETGGGS